MAYKQIPLSGSTNGTPITVSAITSGTAITIHTATTGTSDTQYDLVTVYASNIGDETVLVTLDVNGEEISKKVSRKDGAKPVLLGQYMRNANLLKAYASIASVIQITGIVERTTS